MSWADVVPRTYFIVDKRVWIDTLDAQSYIYPGESWDENYGGWTETCNGIAENERARVSARGQYLRRLRRLDSRRRDAL